MAISVVVDPRRDIESLDFEIVERKGVGHPDTITDAIAEEASRAYSRYCLERFGGIAHHWFDKVLLVGGESVVEYGRGELVRPYSVIFAGKGAYKVGDAQIPLDEILQSAAAKVLQSVLTGFDATKHLRITNLIVDYQGAGRADSRYRPNSQSDLAPLNGRGRASNDCNLLSAYAPFSRLESIVLEVERLLTSPEFKRENPGSGWDVKIVGTRRRDEFDLLVNIPFLANFIKSYDGYLEEKSKVGAKIQSFIGTRFGVDVRLTMNTTDRNGRPYLTVLGSVADTGDAGMVGRGNRFNGLITPMRPMSIEASAGKNPIDHTGKIYSLLAQQIADEVHRSKSVDCQVFITTSKEKPLEDPDEVNVAITRGDIREADLREIEDLIQGRLRTVGTLTEELIFGARQLW